jgi:hypothetical protein
VASERMLVFASRTGGQPGLLGPEAMCAQALTRGAWTTAAVLGTAMVLAFRRVWACTHAAV